MTSYCMTTFLRIFTKNTNINKKRMRFNGKENEIPSGFIKGYKL